MRRLGLESGVEGAGSGYRRRGEGVDGVPDAPAGSVACQPGKYEALAQRLRNPDHGSFAEEYAANPPGAGAEPWLAELLNDLQKRNPKWIPDPLGSDFKVAVVSRSGFDQSDSRGSYTGTEIRLPEHLENCGRIAAEFARDLPERLRRTVLLAA
jgi:hypothetical protein